MPRLIPLLFFTVLLIAGSGCAHALATTQDPGAPVVRLAPADAGGDGPRLRVAGGREVGVEARLEMAVPAEAGGRWLLWLPRDPLDAVEIIGADGSKPLSFFRPTDAEGAFPTGFGFVLPAEASGSPQAHLRIRGGIRSAPGARLMRERDVMRNASVAVAVACTVYAAFATLLLAALALYAAVRDRLFLWYAGYVVSALLFMAAANGHLYAWPGFEFAGRFGARGFWIAILAFNAIALTMLLRLADIGTSRSPRVRRLGLAVPALLVPILVACLPWQAAGDVLQGLSTIAWGVGMPLATWALLDGARRGVPMAFATAFAMLVLMAASGAHEAMHRTWLADTFLTRHGYQFALVLVSVILFVGLSSRLGLVRQRLDDEASARRDSEIRLRREQLRTGLARALQESLHDAGEAEVAPRALRRLAEHAGALLGIDGAVVLGDGYLGQGPLQVPASTAGVGTLHALQHARAVVRGNARGQRAVHVRVDGSRGSDDPSAPLYAIVPLRLRAPAWCALVLPLAARPLDGEELQALEEFARITVTSADEAHASLLLRHTAEHDALTGSQNRRSLDQWLTREFRSMAAADALLAVLFIDIDLFKQVNDTRGHACGDECLRVIANTLRSELRPGDVLGRYGGEEFLVLLPGQDGAAARVVAERLRQAVEATPVAWQDGQLALTVSIGLAARREQDADPAALLARADKALYAAKHEGRNCVRAAPAYSG